MKTPKKTPAAKPSKKPKSDRFYTPRCPECGHSTFSVFPQVVPEIVVQYHDNGDVTRHLEDYSQEDCDQVCCANCGEELTWDQCDHRRKK